ncbi:fused MFS/spermidine synthase [Stenotrophomonas sp. TWI819]|uniref:fused MFS/spermidine synthase n=1 Tax=Stenotrophomonas sp. TWI819 TaxID=3136800 RepID=UPI0032086B17
MARKGCVYGARIRVDGGVVIRFSNARGNWLLAIFVLSGFAGLIYQSIWTQYLGLFLGHSSHAQSLVLMLFMGGMAVGAWLVSRRSSSLRRPLLVYAIIELLIGALGLGFDEIFQAVTSWAYTQVMPGLEGASLSSFRWVLATVLVLPQCVLLGATFPLMSAGYMRMQPDAQGQVLAGLYFSNSLGAACGALASTYLLLPAVGLPGTVMAAGLLNFAVAVLVYPLSRNVIAATPTSVALSASANEPPTNSRLVVMVLLVAALTGASSFVYEITWVRMLSLALGTTLHSFELMLAAFIAGIAFGGFWLRHRADRMLSPLRVAGWVQIWMGLAALASMFVYAQSFEWVGWLMRVIVRSADGYGLYNLASAVIAALVMFPAAFFAGMTLPLLTLALLRAGHGEKAIGQTYAFNTVGAILGVLAAVHILMPMLGLKYALIVAAAVDLGLGLWLLQYSSSNVASYLHHPALRASLVSVAGVIAAVAFVRFDPLVLSSSVYRHGSTRLSESARMLYFRDGATATISLYENDSAIGTIRSVATNGKVDAGMAVSMDQAPTSDESTMILLGALPLAMRDGYERIGVIGFGSGLTTHTLLGDSRVGQVDTVEIEPAMIQGARLFGDRVTRAFEDPRSHVVIDDAKAYFAASPRKYDLIVSEPSNPWVGGTASLFTEEFYAFVPRHLNEDGIFVQWLQLYEITPELVSSVLAGMVGQFSDVRAYLANKGDLILVATPKGKLPALSSDVFDQPMLRAELARIGVHGLVDLEDTLAMNDQALRAFVPLYPSSQNSDYFPVLKLNAPTARFRQARVGDFEAVMTAPWPMREALGSSPPLHRELDERKNLLPSRLLDKRRAAAELSLVMTGASQVERKWASAVDFTQAEALRGVASACRLNDSGVDATSLIFSLAWETIPYLPEAERVTLWNNDRWLACQTDEGSAGDALRLVSAAAAGRHEDVLMFGQALLQGENGKQLMADGTSGYYVFGAMQHAALVMGNASKARELKDKYWSKLSPDARSSGRLRLLTYLAALGSPVSDMHEPRQSHHQN